jgi:protein TonB
MPGEAARGPESAAGSPGSTLAGGAPGTPDIVAVRRRIDARKVYPRVAVRNGWEGRVLVEMRVDGDGSLAAVRLVQGSGHAVLDEATLASVRRASPFPPGGGIITVPVEYRLIP